MKTPYLIGITGGSGSGKTFFLNKLTNAFTEKEVCLISQDNYYKERHLQPLDAKGIQNFDMPKSIDKKHFYKDIQSLREGNTVEKKEYTFNNDAVQPKTLIFKPAPIIIVEGIFVFHYKKIAEMLDLKVFLDAEDHLKVKRRIIRDNKERGYDLEDVLYRYERHVAPTYKKYIAPYKPHCDIIIPNNAGIDNAVEVMIAFLKSKIERA